jgi:hypothetical protein
MSIIGSVIIERTRKYRIVLWVDWTLVTLLLGLNYTIGAKTNRAQTYAFQVLLGAGLGTALVSTIITVMASVTTVDNEGLAAGMLVTVRFVGTLFGLAICSTVFSSTFSRGMSSIQDFPEQIAVLKDSGQAVAFIPRPREIEVPEDIMQVVIGAYEKSFQIVWVVLAAFSALATLLSLMTRENSLEKDKIGGQGFKAPTSK